MIAGSTSLTLHSSHSPHLSMPNSSLNRVQIPFLPNVTKMECVGSIFCPSFRISQAQQCWPPIWSPISLCGEVGSEGEGNCPVYWRVFAASLAFTHQRPVVPSQIWHPRMFSTIQLSTEREGIKFPLLVDGITQRCFQVLSLLRLES